MAHRSEHATNDTVTAARNSTVISTVSTVVLGVAGIALLFGADVLIPRVFPGIGPGAAMLGQLIAAGWLAVAWLDWNQRHTLLGGIYGRPTVLSNVMLYFVSALSLARPAMASDASAGLQALALVFAVMALVYSGLLMRGPFGAIAPAAQ